MSKKGHEYTDEEIDKLEKKLAKIYGRAGDELEKKAAQFLAEFQKEDERLRKAVEKGEVKESEYRKWRTINMMTGEHYDMLKKQVASTLADANKNAISLLNGRLPSVYAFNYNETGKDAEDQVRGFTFDLVNEHAVAQLAMKDKTLLPYKVLDGKKDERWNTQKVNGEIMQGIIQGESIDKIASRLQNVAGMNAASAMRNARTAMTGAENRGTFDAMKELEEEGVIMKKEWIATHDGRTRDSHLAYEAAGPIDMDDEFAPGLMYPGDSDADSEEVYNCRCSLGTVIEGFKKLSGHYVANGNDISETWQRRDDEFDFAIEDVINAQGFDGVPQVVSEKEFEDAVAESNIIAQRGYRAEDVETLNEYRKQLYEGKWYVDCSEGGDVYGKGMYAGYADGTEISEKLSGIAKRYGSSRGDYVGYVETFTMTPDAKMISFDDARQGALEYRKKWDTGEEAYNKYVISQVEKIASKTGMSKEAQAYVCSRYFDVEDVLGKGFSPRDWYLSMSSAERDDFDRKTRHDMIGVRQIINKAVDSNRSIDVGEYAAMKGYDAIKVEEPNFLVVLNRTKVIIKEP